MKSQSVVSIKNGKAVFQEKKLDFARHPAVIAGQRDPAALFSLIFSELSDFHQWLNEQPKEITSFPESFGAMATKILQDLCVFQRSFGSNPK